MEASVLHHIVFLSPNVAFRPVEVFLRHHKLLLSCQSFLINTRTNQGGEWRHCGCAPHSQGVKGRLWTDLPSSEKLLHPTRAIPASSESPCHQLGSRTHRRGQGWGQEGWQEERNGSGIWGCPLSPLSSPGAPLCEFQLDWLLLCYFFSC